jgi:serine/threonine protein kinase
MTCPRCGNEWDVSKTPCSRCGLLVRLPNHSGAAARTQNSPLKQQPGSGNVLAGKQQLNEPLSSLFTSSSSMPMPAPPTSLPKSQRDAARGTGNIGRANSLGTNSAAQPGMQYGEQNLTANTAFPDIRPINPAPLWGRENNNSGQLSSSVGSGALDGFGASFGKNRVSSQPGIAGTDLSFGKNRVSSQPGIAGAENAVPKSVPPRPQKSVADARAEAVADFSARPQPPLRPSRLTGQVASGSNRSTEAPGMRAQSAFVPPSQAGRMNSGGYSGGLSANDALDAGFDQDLRILVPGTLLRSGRYRLQETLGRQEWVSGVYEVMWLAQDAQRSGAEVTICELVTPETGTVMMQSFLRAATMALTSVGRHPRIPTLWDAFSDEGRSFFVFEPIEGESLLMRMHRTGRALPEQDVIECCLQMTEILELLAQQTPPIVHGQIRPENVVMARMSLQYTLTNFSVVLAGGATQFLVGLDRSRLTPYMAPEVVRGVVDVRTDLYSLMATAYHAVTGSIPSGIGSSGTIPQAQRLNPNVSPQFDAILAKGLRVIPAQRYQRPAELRQDLLAMRSVSGSLSPKSVFSPNGGLSQQGFSQRSAQPVADSVAQMLPNMLAGSVANDEEERRLLLPRPEELPPLQPGNDGLSSVVWLIGIVVCLVAIVFWSRGFM